MARNFRRLFARGSGRGAGRVGASGRGAATVAARVVYDSTMNSFAKKTARKGGLMYGWYAVIGGRDGHSKWHDTGNGAGTRRKDAQLQDAMGAAVGRHVRFDAEYQVDNYFFDVQSSGGSSNDTQRESRGDDDSSNEDNGDCRSDARAMVVPSGQSRSECKKDSSRDDGSGSSERTCIAIVQPVLDR